jgi:hypothetical protein
LYVQQTLRFTTISRLHVRPAYSFRTQTTFVYARENYCFAIRHQSYNDMVHCGLTFFPERQTITLRCSNSDNQPHHTMSLQGAGLVRNLSTCYISSSTLRTLPELVGSVHAKLETPNLYLPSNISAVSNYETNQLKDVLPADTSRIDDMTSRLATRKQTFDVDSSFHVQEVSQQQEQRTRWLIVLTTSICVAIILGIFCFNLYSRCRNLQCYALPNASNSELSPHNPTSSTECNQRDTAEKKQSQRQTRHPFYSISNACDKLNRV